ncbi:peptidoglycan bridge formation protein FemAB [Bifidobacterium sp. DSM 109963]|uniref:Peptidoglycan bridge formation protein FemAB n=2 Tax=Bifidobacterium panos TaxID=2675321 RepID=A0ABX1SW51_9BIFI|nr:peptidoglycan bridge formation protein FemAB [Bifidobacterium sp. DSM 109963]
MDMRSFALATLTEEEFDDFSGRHPEGNFQQTSAAGRLRSAQGVEVEYLGVRENGELVAAALLETHRSRLSTFSVIHDGPMCDFHDAELTAFFVEQLKQRAKGNKAAQLEITPELPYRLRDGEGKPLPAEQGGAPANDAVDNLVACGFEHGGFSIGYTAVPRWRYVKDLTGGDGEQALLKSYDKRTQWSVKRAASMGVHVRELGEDELKVFADIERATAERRSFEYRGEGYFRRFKEAYGSKAHFMVAEIHIAEYRADMQAKRDALKTKVAALEAKIAERETTKLTRQLGEESRNLAAAEKRLAEAAELAKKGDVLPAAASLFVEHPRETVYLFSGSVEEYKPFYASALIQHYAMLHLCLERGVNRYNFYGVDGVFDDPDDPGRGVLEFKQGFNGYVEELMGEFVLPVRPIMFRAKTTLRKLLGR